MSEIYNVDARYFSKWFKKLGLEVRSNKVNSRVYDVNHEYFEVIDSPEKAYWLGFIYADGYVSSSNGKRVGISLSIKDRTHLKSFNRCVGSSYKIHNYISNTSYKDNTEYSRIIISSDKMYDDLVRHGAVENKTNILEPPKINDSLVRYFILGYFDGDGSIFLNNSRSPFYSISIVGTKGVLTFIHDYLRENGIISNDLKLEKRYEHHEVYYIRYGGNISVNNIMSHLYDGIDTDIVLKRKYDLYIKCKNKQFS